MSESEGSSRVRKGMSILGYVALIAFFVYLGQIYLNRPGDRPVAACWVPFKIVWVVWVDGTRIFAWKYPEISLGAAQKTATFNKWCICNTSKFTWLTKSEKPNLPYTCE